MKILWFTLTPSLYDVGTHHYKGGGWIESLEGLVREDKDIELAVSFFHPRDNGKVMKNGARYYPVLRPKARRSPIKSVFNNFMGRIDEDKYIPKFLEVIEDFEPDVIHIFGTESIFASIQQYTDVPVLVHLQGLINPCLNAYFPPFVNKWNFLFNFQYLPTNLVGMSPFFSFKKFEKQAKREKEHFKNMKFILGRTQWDRKVSNILAPQAEYFHGDEVLRPVFYTNDRAQVAKNATKIQITSTISPTVYKGIDVILKTAKLLKQDTNISFEWKIIGLQKENSLLKFFEKYLDLSHRDININCLGVKNADQIVDILNDSDVYIHPSYIDNSPNSICEAQLLGKPVIACNVGGVPSLIQDGESGVLVPSNGVYEIVDNIKELDAHPEKFLKIGATAREKASERHERKKILRELSETYSKIIS